VTFIIDLRGEEKPIKKVPILMDVKEVQKLKKYIANNGALFIPPYELELPKLPEWTNRVYYYKQYKMNLYQFTCSCEWWKNKRKIYPVGDLRLVCKHLYYKISSSSKLLETIDDLSLMLIKSYLFHGENMLLKAVLAKEKLTFYIGARYFGDWYNVYTKAGDNWKRYSYSMLEKRWSYDRVPEHEKIILDYLKKKINLFKNYFNRKD